MSKFDRHNNLSDSETDDSDFEEVPEKASLENGDNSNTSEYSSCVFKKKHKKKHKKHKNIRSTDGRKTLIMLLKVLVGFLHYLIVNH